MTKTVFEIMDARYIFLSKTISSLKKKKDLYPEGSINIRPNVSGFSYYLYKDKSFKYLSKKDTVLIKQLIQKDLISQAIKTSQKEAAVLQKFISEYPIEVVEDLYEHLPESRKKYASPLFLNNEEYAQYWLSIPFTPKPIGEDVPDFYTQKGEHVRSKSEVIIGDRLYANGIPYKYECPLKVGKDIIHPDFTILRLSDRKILYHEHCGKMGDKSYVEDMVSRVNQYGKAGIYCGDKLYFSFESSDQPLDISWLDDFIEKNYR